MSAPEPQQAEAAADRAGTAQPAGATTLAAPEAAAAMAFVSRAHVPGAAQLQSLQRAAGNGAVSQLLSGIQRAPNHNSGTKAKSGPTDTYADLFNGFQEMSSKAINNAGAGMDTVTFGKDLTSDHRHLLESVRDVFDQARTAGNKARGRLAIEWHPLAAKLQKAMGEARHLHLSGAVLSAVADDLDLVGRDYIETHKSTNEIALELMEGGGDFIVAMDSMLYEFSQMGESSPGMLREEVPNRKDAQVSQGLRDIYAKRQEAINGVKIGSHLVGRHLEVLKTLRQALITARSEKAGSADRARTLWRSIEPEAVRVIDQAERIGEQVPGRDPKAIERVRKEIEQHYALVHQDNLSFALTQERSDTQIQQQRQIERTGSPEAIAELKEGRALGDVKHALDTIQNHLVPSPEHPGEWILTSGATVIRIREDQAQGLRVAAAKSINDYMAEITKGIVAVWMTYDSIKRGNSAFKLHVLGGWGGADDPGNPEHFKDSAIRVRDGIIKPLVEQGKLVEAFSATLNQKGIFEQIAKDVGDYDRDLDTGYSRLGVAMTAIQLTLAALVPAAGAATAGSLAAVAAVGTAAGGGGAFIAEGTRQLATGDHDAGLLAKRTFGGAATGLTAAAPGATNALTEAIAPAGLIAPAAGSDLVIARGAASSIVGAAQSGITGGDPLQGGLVGGLGSLAGGLASGLGPIAQSPLGQGAVGAAVGYGAAKLTGQDPISATVSGFVGGAAMTSATKSAGGAAGAAEGAESTGAAPEQLALPAPAEPGAAAPAPPAEETWLGRPANSDLPQEPVGAAIGRGIPKVTSRNVATPDAVMKEGVGVGNMFTPIKRGVMKPIGKPSSGSSESVVMVDTTSGKKYLFKPLGGEPDVPYAEDRGVVAGHYAERARAGAISAGELGVATPDVRMVEINGRKGSLTTWVEPTEGGQMMGLDEFAKQNEQNFKDLQKTPEFVDALSGIEALDYLVNNLDRVNNLTNYMIEVGPGGTFKRLIPIDQELSFTRTAERAIVPGKTSMMPRRWTPELAQRVAALHDDPGSFVTKIRPLVGDEAVAGVLARLDQLYANGMQRGAIRPAGRSSGAGATAAPSSAGETPLAPGGETAATN